MLDSNKKVDENIDEGSTLLGVNSSMKMSINNIKIIVRIMILLNEKLLL